MQQGDSFLMPIPGQDYPHLWIVISDPDTHQGAFVIVNLTKDEDRAGKECPMGPADHPWIRDNCFVSFSDALEITPEKAAFIERLIQKDKIKMHARMEAAIVERIKVAARASKALPKAFKKYL